MNRSATLMLSLFFVGSMVASDTNHKDQGLIFPIEIWQLIIEFIQDSGLALRCVNRFLRDNIQAQIHYPIMLYAKYSIGENQARSQRRLLGSMMDKGHLLLHDFLVFEDFFSKPILVSATKKGAVKLRILGRNAVNYFLGQIGWFTKCAVDSRCEEDVYECTVERKSVNSGQDYYDIQPGKGLLFI